MMVELYNYGTMTIRNLLDSPTVNMAYLLQGNPFKNFTHLYVTHRCQETGKLLQIFAYPDYRNMDVNKIQSSSSTVMELTL